MEEVLEIRKYMDDNLSEMGTQHSEDIYTPYIESLIDDLNTIESVFFSEVIINCHNEK